MTELSKVKNKPEGFAENLRKGLKTNMKQYTILIALVGMAIVFTFLTDGTFITARNLSNLLLQTATVSILACGMLLVIVGGHIDLSVGSVAGFCGAIAAILQVKMGWATVPTILATLAVGVLIGLWQGFWVAYVGIPAFIVTLGGMEIFRGAVIGVTNGATIAPMQKSFKALGQSFVPNLFIKSGNLSDTTFILGAIAIVIYLIYEARNRKARKKYGFKVLPPALQLVKLIGISACLGLFTTIMGIYKGIPYCVIIVIALVLIYSYITNKTTFGRYVYAVGGNKEAARLSGINIKKVNMLIFISMGVLSALAGIVFTARLDSATAAAGNLFELLAIASCYIGGASTLGGEGTIVGAFIGSFVMSTISNGMSLMNASITWQYIVTGLVLILAVTFDITSKKKA